MLRLIKIGGSNGKRKSRTRQILGKSEKWRECMTGTTFILIILSILLMND